MLECPLGQVYVHARRGWEPRSRESAVSELMARLGWIMGDLLTEVEKTPLRALIPWFEARVEELTGQEPVARIVTNYLSAAARYYGSLTPRPDSRDRREAARRLLRPQPRALENGADSAPDRFPPLTAHGNNYLQLSFLAPEHAPQTQAERPSLSAIESVPPTPAPLTDADLEELLGW